MYTQKHTVSHSQGTIQYLAVNQVFLANDVLLSGTVLQIRSEGVSPDLLHFKLFQHFIVIFVCHDFSIPQITVDYTECLEKFVCYTLCVKVRKSPALRYSVSGRGPRVASNCHARDVAI